MSKSINNSRNNDNTELRTAESVSPGHPDKICDQISDAILDAHLRQDPLARVAVDVAGGHGKILVTGEVSSRTKKVDVTKIVKRLAGDIELIENIATQSLEIAQGVDTGGAGDQGIMIGYACDETPELLPAEVVLSRRLNQFLYKKWPYDGKTQVTLSVIARGATTKQPSVIRSVVASWQNVAKDELKQAVNDWILEQVQNDIATAGNDLELHINPAGDWNQGSFDSDAGLTGRKLAVDNYGPRIPIGGGAFSGKDATKVDRSAAYIARRIAVDYLKKRKAHEVFVRLAYAIGYDQPLEKTVIIDGKAEEIATWTSDQARNDVRYDLTPNGIIEFLNLRRPIYEATARYGHFGEGFNWDA
ncbi:S-adenosylmethionine synthase [Alphaproteobacteria bacterium]|nr:S-adenosylmethionine synthase [Alphaproteobacteria bacterium]